MARSKKTEILDVYEENCVSLCRKTKVTGFKYDPEDPGVMLMTYSEPEDHSDDMIFEDVYFYVDFDGTVDSEANRLVKSIIDPVTDQEIDIYVQLPEELERNYDSIFAKVK